VTDVKILTGKAEQLQDGRFVIRLPNMMLKAYTRMQMKELLEKAGYYHPWYFQGPIQVIPPPPEGM